MRLRAATLILVLLASPAWPQAAYELPWWTVAGGGAMGLTGGPYVLDATAGQPATGALSGGPYSLAGGFWPGSAPAGEVAADLSLTISDSPDPVTGLQPLTYDLAVSNAGPSAAKSVVVSDRLPAGVVFQSAGGSGWACTEAGSIVTCARVNLPVGAAPALTITVTAPPAAQTLVNVASVEAQELDPVPGNNSDTESTTVLAAPTADLRISKSDGDVVATWGQPLTYTVIVTNGGPAAVTGALARDIFPVSLSGVTWTCTASAGSSCPASGSGSIDHAVNLLAGGTGTFIATGSVLPGTYASIVNTATISVPAGVVDPVQANNIAVETTPVAPPDLIFQDGFDDGTFDAWSGTTGEGLTLLRGAARYGPYGLFVKVGGGSAPKFVLDDSPVAESRYRVRFYLRLDRLQMAVGDEFELFRAMAPDKAAKLRLVVGARDGHKTLRAVVILDDGSVATGNEATLSAGWHWVEVDWRAGSSPGANDGQVDLWVDDQLQPPLNGLDTDLARIGLAAWGVVSGLDPGTTGVFALDEFVSRRQSPIGPLPLGPPPLLEQLPQAVPELTTGAARLVERGEAGMAPDDRPLIGSAAVDDVGVDGNRVHLEAAARGGAAGGAGAAGPQVGPGDGPRAHLVAVGVARQHDVGRALLDHLQRAQPRAVLAVPLRDPARHVLARLEVEAEHQPRAERPGRRQHQLGGGPQLDLGRQLELGAQRVELLARGLGGGGRSQGHHRDEPPGGANGLHAPGAARCRLSSASCGRRGAFLELVTARLPPSTSRSGPSCVERTTSSTVVRSVPSRPTQQLRPAFLAM
jgi:uncharacterized repeat protein (TIGR01451 family)